eukprot:g16864.t1
MNRLANKVAIITGASKGLGEADSRRFIEEDATVIMTDIDEDAGQKLAAELGDKAEFHKQDVRDEEAWKTLIAGVVERHGGLHVLVNNAGVVQPGSIEDQTIEEWDFIMDVSARGAFLGCKYAIPAMKKSGGGSIINMASIASIQGEERIAAYSAAKGAVQGLTLSIAAYGARNKLNIRCNSLHPSAMVTPMVINMRAQITDEQKAQRAMVSAEELGSRLGPMLVKAGHEVTALHRKPEQAEELEAAGTAACLGDLMEMTADDLIRFTENTDVIVFSAGAAGSGLERTSKIDGEGVTNAIHAAKANGIKRFYLVSAMMDAGRDLPRNDRFEHYMAVKRQADNELVASGLDWVILRPGALVSEDGSGLVNANLAVPFGEVARGNVAAMLAELIDTPEIAREIIELTDGDVAVKDAVQMLKR